MHNLTREHAGGWLGEGSSPHPRTESGTGALGAPNYASPQPTVTSAGGPSARGLGTSRDPRQPGAARRPCPSIPPKDEVTVSILMPPTSHHRHPPIRHLHILQKSGHAGRNGVSHSDCPGHNPLGIKGEEAEWRWGLDKINFGQGLGLRILIRKWPIQSTSRAAKTKVSVIALN